MTLSVFPTTTRVRLAPEAGQDTVVFNGRPATGEAERRIVAFLDLVRERAGSALRAVVDTENTVPTGAGLASSASGFAALAVAASAAYGLDLDARGLSRLARRGSGSASRSIFGGFAVWHAGTPTGTPQEADASSYAEPVDAARLDPALVVAVVNAGPKEVSSRTAMRRTMDTSPLFEPWAESSKADLVDMRAALGRGDLEAVGEIAERNALGMHATMLAARPAVRYMSAGLAHRHRQRAATAPRRGSGVRDDGRRTERQGAVAGARTRTGWRRSYARPPRAVRCTSPCPGRVPGCWTRACDGRSAGRGAARAGQVVRRG